MFTIYIWNTPSLEGADSLHKYLHLVYNLSPKGGGIVLPLLFKFSVHCCQQHFYFVYIDLKLKTKKHFSFVTIWSFFHDPISSENRRTLNDTRILPFVFIGWRETVRWNERKVGETKLFVFFVISCFGLTTDKIKIDFTDQVQVDKWKINKLSIFNNGLFIYTVKSFGNKNFCL